ncbi:MAG: hypothetical protein ACTMUB_05100 [cyanobacterium endosymbiont of Rhopalodia musculus]
MYPHSPASNSLVFSDKEVVRIFPATLNRLIIVVDGNGGLYVSPEDRVHVIKLLYLAHSIRLESPEFFRLLQKRLGLRLPHAAKLTSVKFP